jgi:hypothetical protein
LGISGFAVAAALVVLIFKLHNEDISWIIGRHPLTASFCNGIDADLLATPGWTVPWVWAAVCALITVARTKAALKKESLHFISERK